MFRTQESREDAAVPIILATTLVIAIIAMVIVGFPALDILLVSLSVMIIAILAWGIDTGLSWWVHRGQ